jgi:carbohydrate-selective porin OprB
MVKGTMLAAVLSIATVCLCLPARGSEEQSAVPKPPPPASEAKADTSNGPFPPTPDYRGNLLKRAALTGDWEGWRTYLAGKGFTLDVDLTQIFQGNLGGGADSSHSFPYGGSGDLQAYIDTGKMGLWPGGFISVLGEMSYGRSNNLKTGALMPVNASALFPAPGLQGVTLTEYKIIQFLSPKFGLFAGKIDTLNGGGDANVFAYDYKNQFMNAAFLVNPVTFRTVPYSALGAGAIYIFSEHLMTSFMALDANGDATHAGFDTAFSDPRGITLGNEWILTMKPLGKTGHFRAGGVYSTKRYALLDQDPRLDFPEFQIQPDGELANRVRDILNRDNALLKGDADILRRADGIIRHDRTIDDRDRRALERAAEILEKDIIAGGGSGHDADILRRARQILRHDRRIDERDRRILDRAADLLKSDITARAKDALAREKEALSDKSRFLLERAGELFLSDKDRALKKGSGDYCFYFNFDQYLYTDKEDPAQGFGLFGRFGLSDGRFNPVERFYSIGLGGKGVIPTRESDTYGVGYYYTETSKDLPSILGMGCEQGVELYYNCAVTEWLKFTPDFQVIHPALRNVPPVTVLGFRTTMNF